MNGDFHCVAGERELFDRYWSIAKERALHTVHCADLRIGLARTEFCNLCARRIARRVRCAVIFGGTPLEYQFETLDFCPYIVFPTPGRLLQILAEMGARGGLTVATADTVDFHKADRLFEGTLAVETAALIDNLRDKQTELLGTRQTVLVSSTMPNPLAEFSRTRLRKFNRHSIGRGEDLIENACRGLCEYSSVRG